MFKTGKKPPEPPDRLVWLLGSRHPNADRSIGWDDEFPNLSDPDVLIVDLTTLTGRTLARLDQQKLDYARKVLRDKLFHKGIIVVISQPKLSPEPPPAQTVTHRTFHTPEISARHSYSNYTILPASLYTKNVSEGHKINMGCEHDFKEYMGCVKGFTFYIKRWLPNIALQREHHRFFELRNILAKDVKDNAGNDLGFTLVLVVSNDGVNFVLYEDTGQLVFLPPPEEPVEDAIGKILSVYGKTVAQGEVEPSWAASMSFDPLPELEAQIKGLEENKKSVQDEIDALANRKMELRGHLKLLYSSGTELELAVASAFNVLGFAEARRAGGGDSPDVVFDMSAGSYSRGVVEVKGRSKRTSLNDIYQCEKWTAPQEGADGALLKGIFVPNQYRRHDYRDSLKKRSKFETNEKKYAEEKGICVIPSHVLFEAVRQVLGGKRADRKAVEEKIANCRGVLDNVA